MHLWIREQPKIFFSDGTRQPVDCCKKCVEVQGDMSKNNIAVKILCG